MHVACWCPTKRPGCVWRGTAHVDNLWRSEYCTSILPALERDYEKYKDQVLIHQALTINQDNKNGDYMLSQGFSTIHVESTIG